MRPAPLERGFFSRPTLIVARALLGKTLCHRVGRRVLCGRIVEVEAYTVDAASHAREGRRTPRNGVVFGPAGFAYVYFTYGMHYCFNIVAEDDGRPGAVLVRGLDQVRALAWPSGDVDGTETDILPANGPALLCRALGITKLQNGLDLTGDHLWIAAGGRRRSERIVQTTRIGIRVAAELPWRFYLLGSAGVSRRDRAAEALLSARTTYTPAGKDRSASGAGRHR